MKSLLFFALSLVMEAVTDKKSSLQEFMTAQKLTFETKADFV